MQRNGAVKRFIAVFKASDASWNINIHLPLWTEDSFAISHHVETLIIIVPWTYNRIQL